PACAEHGCDTARKRTDVPEHFLALVMGGGLCPDHCRRGRNGTRLCRRSSFTTAPLAFAGDKLQPRQGIGGRCRRSRLSRLVLWLHGDRRRVVPDVAIVAMERSRGGLSFLSDDPGGANLCHAKGRIGCCRDGPSGAWWAGPRALVAWQRVRRLPQRSISTPFRWRRTKRRCDWQSRRPRPIRSILLAPSSSAPRTAQCWRRARTAARSIRSSTGRSSQSTTMPRATTTMAGPTASYTPPANPARCAWALSSGPASAGLSTVARSRRWRRLASPRL